MYASAAERGMSLINFIFYFRAYSLHIQPGGIDEVCCLVGSGPPPLHFDLAGLVQAEGAVAVMHCLHGFIATQVALSSIARKEKEKQIYIRNTPLSSITNYNVKSRL